MTQQLLETAVQHFMSVTTKKSDENLRINLYFASLATIPAKNPLTVSFIHNVPGRLLKITVCLNTKPLNYKHFFIRHLHTKHSIYCQVRDNNTGENIRAMCLQMAL